LAGDTVIRFGKATIQIKGMDALFKELSKLGENVQNVGADVFNGATQRVLAASQVLVPVDPEDGGQLRDSGRRTKARIDRRTGNVRASVSYGGARLARHGDNPIYAIVQHEDLTLKHTRGEAKFLERPYLAEREITMESLRARIAAKIKAN
jgi:hypothetical protein